MQESDSITCEFPFSGLPSSVLPDFTRPRHIQPSEERHSIHDPPPIPHQREQRNDSSNDEQRDKPRGRLVQVALFFRGVEMPNDIIREPDDAVAGDPGQLGETFGLDLVVDGFVREVDACAVRAVFILDLGGGGFIYI